MRNMIQELKQERDKILDLVDRFKGLKARAAVTENTQEEQVMNAFNQELEEVLVDLRDVTFKFNAAKRALGLINKLSKHDPTITRHRSRVFGTMNRLRAAIRRLEKAITQIEKEYGVYS